MVTSLHSAKNHINRKSLYLHYTSVVILIDTEFPMTLTQIKKFENLNDISINVYNIENKKEIFPLGLTKKKMDKHVNLLYVQNDDHVRYFAWIKDLSRLVNSQLSRQKKQEILLRSIRIQ